MGRTIIERTKDRSFLLVRESRVGISGNAKNRRHQKRAGTEETWRITNRVITRDLQALPEKAKDWPGLEQMVSSDVNIVQADSNQFLMEQYKERASRQVEEIETHNSNFSIPAPARIRVVFEEILHEA